MRVKRSSRQEHQKAQALTLISLETQFHMIHAPKRKKNRNVVDIESIIGRRKDLAHNFPKLNSYSPIKRKGK